MTNRVITLGPGTTNLPNGAWRLTRGRALAWYETGQRTRSRPATMRPGDRATSGEGAQVVVHGATTEWMECHRGCAGPAVAQAMLDGDPGAVAALDPMDRAMFEAFRDQRDYVANRIRDVRDREHTIGHLEQSLRQTAELRRTFGIELGTASTAPDPPSGDFVDVVLRHSPDMAWIICGDADGHGGSAREFGLLVRGLLRQEAERTHAETRMRGSMSPLAAMAPIAAANTTLGTAGTRGHFVALAVHCITWGSDGDDPTVRTTYAGFPLATTTNRLGMKQRDSLPEGPGVPIGLTRANPKNRRELWPTVSGTLTPGDVRVITSDGVPELDDRHHNPTTLAGTADDIARTLLMLSLSNDAGDPCQPTDDATVTVMRRT